MKAFIVWVIGLGIFGTLLVSGSSPSNQAIAEPASEKICVTESIPFETEEQDNDGYDVGDNFVSQEGVEGEREVCTIDDVEVSNEIVSEPVSEVMQIGTYEEEYDYSYRIGAWCWDGTWSDATGSGACSWHDGVRVWVYE